MRFDVVSKMEDYWNGPRYVALDDGLGVTRYTQATESGEEVTDRMLQHLHDRLVVCKGLRMQDEERFASWSEWFEEEFWPLLSQKSRKLRGLYDFYMEHAIYSDAVQAFDYDAWTNNFATACLLGHGITHDFDGVLKPIDMDDPMLIYIKENSSLCFMRYRSDVVQEEMKNLPRNAKVGLFGGGADPSIWRNDFLSLRSDLQFVIYDMNDMSDELTQILDADPRRFGIEYHVANFFEAYQDPTQIGMYDMIVFNGVMSYYPEKKADILRGAAQLLKAGGAVIYDDQLMHPDMKFAMLVRGWTVDLKPEPSLIDAETKNASIVEEVGLRLDFSKHQEIRGIPNVVCTKAVK